MASTTRPRLLDLFCGAGGSAVGYHRAGFEMVGVDIKPQPRYPFDSSVADALEVMDALLRGGYFNATVGLDGRGWWELGDFDAIHASPPCQRYSTATKRNGTQDEHPDLIAETREVLEATGLPYVIENVVGAPLNEFRTRRLCGSGFGLTEDGYYLRRHRMFEVGWTNNLDESWPVDNCRCREMALMPLMDVTGGGPTRKERSDGGGGRPYKGTADQARRIMGIDWMTKAELNEAIPPAYTELIGNVLMQHIRTKAVA